MSPLTCLPLLLLVQDPDRSQYITLNAATIMINRVMAQSFEKMSDKEMDALVRREGLIPVTATVRFRLVEIKVQESGDLHIWGSITLGRRSVRSFRTEAETADFNARANVLRNMEAEHKAAVQAITSEMAREITEKAFKLKYDVARAKFDKDVAPLNEKAAVRKAFFEEVDLVIVVVGENAKKLDQRLVRQARYPTLRITVTDYDPKRLDDPAGTPPMVGTFRARLDSIPKEYARHDGFPKE